MHVEVALAVHRDDRLEGHLLHPVDGPHQHSGLVAIADRVHAAVRGGRAMQEPADNRVDLGVDGDDAPARASAATTTPAP